MEGLAGHQLDEQRIFWLQRWKVAFAVLCCLSQSGRPTPSPWKVRTWPGSFQRNYWHWSSETRCPRCWTNNCCNWARCWCRSPRRRPSWPRLRRPLLPRRARWSRWCKKSFPPCCLRQRRGPRGAGSRFWRPPTRASTPFSSWTMSAWSWSPLDRSWLRRP